jgi:guanine deaminase
MSDDRKFLRRAIEIAADGIDTGGGPFGALIVKEGRIIAESNNRVVIDSDPTAHAEILAIRKASVLLATHQLTGCIIYSSCEPCPMCLGAIYWSGIKRVVYASERKDAASAGFKDEHIYEEISLDPEIRQVSFIHLEDPEASELFRKWEKYDLKVKY